MSPDLSARGKVGAMPAAPVVKFGRRSVAVSLAALLALVAFPAGASAALKWRACANEDGFQCATLRVPLDRSGATPGTIGLRVARESRRVKGGQYFLSLSGGPGQGAVAAAPFVADAMAPALQRRRLVVLDQRGTGDSGVLRCPTEQRARPLNPHTASMAEHCATQLGPNRQYYATADSVADLDDLRTALGVEKWTLQGTSYGTYVAQQYARLFPTHVDRLVLDSVVGPDGVDAFLTDSWGALPRILQENCAHDRCQAITADPVGDVRALAARLDAAPLKGFVVDAQGRRRRSELGAVGLTSLLISGDLNSHLRSALPGAVRAAVLGDPAPILRLIAPAVGPPLGLRDLSYGLNAATTCADNVLPYPVTAPIADRPPRIAQALQALPDASLGPFSRGLIERVSVAEQCKRWPAGRFVPPSTAPLPDVKTLVLSGRLDIRTPLENGAAVAHELPHAQFVTVPGSGHDEIDSDLSGCVARALFRFFTDRRLGDACVRTSNAVPPAPLAPKTFHDLAQHRGVPGDRGRVLRAAVGALDDVRESYFRAADAGLPSNGGGGLRAGSWSTRGQTGLTLRGVAWAPEVKVTGRVTSRLGRYAGTLRVRAPGGLSGVLRFTRTKGVTGTLGGKRVHLPARAVRGAVEPALINVLG